MWNRIIRKFRIGIVRNRRRVIRIYGCRRRRNCKGVIKLWRGEGLNSNMRRRRVKVISLMKNCCCKKWWISICKNRLFYLRCGKSMGKLK